MTHAENLMVSALKRLQSAHATGSDFTLHDTSGELGAFVGVVQDTSLQTFIEGGTADDRSVTIVAEIGQFETAAVTPVAGMSVVHDGLRYVIESITGRGSDPTAYTIRAVVPVKPRK